MNIAYVYPEDIPSKKARAVSVVNSAHEISKINKCTLFISSQLKTSREEIFKSYNIADSGLDIVKIKKTFLGLKSNKFFNKNLLKEIKKYNIDVIYVRHLKAARFFIENKSNNQKLIFECHEIFYLTLHEEQPASYKKIEMLKELEEFVYEHCDGLTFANKTLQKYFNLTFNKIQKKQAIAYNGMNFDERYIQKEFSKINEIYYIGNFFKWKGIEDAIKLLTLVNNISLEIVGGDSKERVEELKHLISDLKVENRVIFHGFQATDRVKEILQNKAKITIIPNTKSVQNMFSMPIKLYEYMATSNIVIAADMDTIKEIIVDGENGFLFESGNVESLKVTLEKVLLLSNEKLQEISKKAYEASKEFSWEKRAHKIVGFCSEVLND
jgi:glycosyltransferase involved in cell wall biosynthesis